jgi:hypothetical protein
MEQRNEQWTVDMASALRPRVLYVFVLGLCNKTIIFHVLSSLGFQLVSFPHGVLQQQA